MKLAEDELKLKTEERPVELMKELPEIEEMAACGTAAVISPVGQLWVNDQWYKFYKNGEEVGPIMQQLYDSLTQIQQGEREDIYQWTREVRMN